MRSALAVVTLAIAACGPVPRETTALGDAEIAQVRLAVFGVADEREPIPASDPRAAELRAVLRERVDQFGGTKPSSRAPEQILRDRIDQLGHPQRP
jgi:hypothetical protein